MIERYYNNAIEQVFFECGKISNNSLLIRYSNDFSVTHLESVNCLKGQSDVFFACHEFSYEKISGAYEPYLSIIYALWEKNRCDSMEDFLKECDVYKPHQSILLSYFTKGICVRCEDMILEDAAYEQERMVNEICTMLLTLAREQKIMLVLNRFQLASKSTMHLTEQLLRLGNPNIAMILGVNEEQTIPEFLRPKWDAILEYMEDRNKVYHIGDSGMEKSLDHLDEGLLEFNTKEGLCILHNMVELLDVEQAFYLLKRYDRMIKFDNLGISRENRYQMLVLLIQTSIMMRDFAKASETCEELENYQDASEHFTYDYQMSVAAIKMYLGKLKEAGCHAKKAKEYALKIGDDFMCFRAELLHAQIQMSGWYNIFFCAKDMEISEWLLQKLEAYQYKNHLGYICIYAYDNDPNLVAKAYLYKEPLQHFDRGVAIAKEIGNEKLLDTAYQKNLMLMSTNGRYEVALYYAIRIYEHVKDRKKENVARIYSSMGYLLCAMGQSKIAQPYFEKAMELFFQLQKPEDIAEVQYNMSLNCIMQGSYLEAESYLIQCMKAVEKLQLNSLRVCNLSKLYGLLALTSILQKNGFNGERYLYKCKQFLNYIEEKGKVVNTFDTVHDYAKSDDDFFLYHFSMALLCSFEEKKEEAYRNFKEAEHYLKRSEGNLFFCTALFRKSYMELLVELSKEEEYHQEEMRLKAYEAAQANMYAHVAEWMKKELPQLGKMLQKVSSHRIGELIHHEGIERAYKSKKSQLEFMTLWQKQFETTGASKECMVDTAMKVFINHFDVDRAVYICYSNRKPCVLYNDTGCNLSTDSIKKIEKALKKDTEGFVVSKISSNYSEHRDITSIFGEENVCSLVAIPYFDNAKIESILITFVTMKDNWHSSVNRYMLNDDDLGLYRLLFREMRYALNRIEAYEKIYEINQKLYLSAVTDQLTGIYNREGFYRKLKSLLEEFAQGKKEPKLGIMFVDLDNFKPYNDTYGHDIGDFVLVQMADMFQNLCENEGFVCRYGGDEFLLVFYTDDRNYLEEKAKKLYQLIEEAEGFEKEILDKIGNKVTARHEKHISCSIGITTATDIRTEDDLNSMIKRADDLLYCIKTTEKGTYKL